MSDNLNSPTPAVTAVGFLSDMLTAAFGTVTGVAVLSFPGVFAINADSTGGRAFAIAMALAAVGVMTAPVSFLRDVICRRIEDRRSEKSIPVTDELLREIAALVNAGRIRQANRLTRKTVDPQSTAFAAFRYIETD